MIFKENSLSLDFSNYKAKAGSLLLAEPFMNDGYFKRSVVLLAIHNEKEGSLGFIINKPIKNVSLADSIKIFSNAKDWPLYFGGPVQTSSLFYIHTLGDLVEDSKDLGHGIYFGGDFETIKQLVIKDEATPQDIKFFLGYSGWGEQQLEEEILNNSWLTTPARKELVFGKCIENTCWQKAIYHTPHFYVAHFPQNSMWN
ncbi:MAG: YqgE/AlgH family protein [Bacteroidia bacterium]|nr:YqgE/AlgH family protein [Bacteroidia bacterium]